MTLTKKQKTQTHISQSLTQVKTKLKLLLKNTKMFSF